MNKTAVMLVPPRNYRGPRSYDLRPPPSKSLYCGIFWGQDSGDVVYSAETAETAETAATRISKHDTVV